MMFCVHRLNAIMAIYVAHTLELCIDTDVVIYLAFQKLERIKAFAPFSSLLVLEPEGH